MVNKNKSKRPNIIIYLADDLGYGDIGCYGSKIHQTPHLDKLAEEGVRFSDFHSNGCMCSPTRAGLLTGRYQQRCGLEFGLNRAIKENGDNFRGMSSAEKTFGSIFSQAGYKTGFFGKYHTGRRPQFSPLKMDFKKLYYQSRKSIHYLMSGTLLLLLIIIVIEIFNIFPNPYILIDNNGLRVCNRIICLKIFYNSLNK